MSLDLLDTPVRLTWDLHGPGSPLNDAQMLTLAARIAAAGVFFVTLEEQPFTHRVIEPLLRCLAAGGCQLKAVFTGSQEEFEILERGPLPPVTLLIDAAAFADGDRLEESRLFSVVDRLRHRGFEPVLQLTPTRSNLSIIPECLGFCRRAGIGNFRLPNARIGDTFRSIPPVDLPRWSDLELFQRTWALAAPQDPGQLTLEIHDRFLWEIMTPGLDQARSEYGGCQAGNSLGHVDAGGAVYACAAWPEPFGSLLDDDLETIWQSPRRFAVRERIAQTPAGCLGCRDFPLCFGGCRGLGEILNAEGGGRDLMCRQPRR